MHILAMSLTMVQGPLANVIASTGTSPLSYMRSPNSWIALQSFFPQVLVWAHAIPARCTQKIEAELWAEIVYYASHPCMSAQHATFNGWLVWNFGNDECINGHVPWPFTLSKMYSRYKVDMPNSVSYLNWTPIFEWYVVRWCSKNLYPKDMCLKRLESHAQNMITI